LECHRHYHHYRQYCDAAGAIEALTLLDKYIAPGCILLFDDLINYPGYREHEILALWEWLEETGRKLEVRHFALYVCFACVHSVHSLSPAALCAYRQVLNQTVLSTLHALAGVLQTVCIQLEDSMMYFVCPSPRTHCIGLIRKWHLLTDKFTGAVGHVPPLFIDIV